MDQERIICYFNTQKYRTGLAKQDQAGLGIGELMRATLLEQKNPKFITCETKCTPSCVKTIYWQLQKSKFTF